MSKKRYNKTFRITVAKEANLPENKGMEHVIAQKYDVRPHTVKRWAEAYAAYGEEAFSTCTKTLNGTKKSDREKELEKEIANLKEENEILKKAAAFLADLRRE